MHSKFEFVFANIQFMQYVYLDNFKKFKFKEIYIYELLRIFQI